MRKEVTDRLYKTYTYQSVDRVPDIEFGYWPQTIRRWLKEGMQIELTKEEQNNMFLGKLDEFLGRDTGEGFNIGLRTWMNPAFEQIVIEKRGDAVLMRDSNGATALRYQSDVEESSIPHFIEFPVKTPDDWKEMKERFRLDDPIRIIP